mmetsp:Transcript_20258/g.25595  ORF Transcript_20258/g.25595 Transcript_20258/m.25595 type:complete len:307 (-) Transcript_20258:1489-2409(-)
MTDHLYKLLYNPSSKRPSSAPSREEHSKSPPMAQIKFVLNRKGGTRCVLKLDHPGLNSPNKDEHQNYIAFKVKSLQPHRYSVRPRQGIVAPGKSVPITIFLLEREKEMLLDNFYLRHKGKITSKDKKLSSVSATIDTSSNRRDEFLLQTFTLKQKFKASKFKGKENKKLVQKDLAKDTKKQRLVTSQEESEELSKVWSIANNIVGIPIQNKKIKVRHVVDKLTLESDIEKAQKEQKEATTPPIPEENPQLENMTADEMMQEIQALRALNLKLAAERDALQRDQQLIRKVVPENDGKVKKKTVKWIG